MSEAIVMMLPALVKAHVDNGRRIVEVEASSEHVDSEGDVILQAGLLASAKSFVEHGHLDLDHISEIGHRYGIRDPESFIIGRPLEVKDIGGGSTSVVGEIKKSIDGTVDTRRNRYDEFWKSMESVPPTVWYASVYGFPGMDLEDCSDGFCASRPDVKRFLVKSFDWRSLALTRRPKNMALKKSAKIVLAKSYGLALMKGMDPSDYAPPLIQDMADLKSHTACSKCAVGQFPFTEMYKSHFLECKGMSVGEAEIYAHAAMHARNVEIVSKRRA